MHISGLVGAFVKKVMPGLLISVTLSTVTVQSAAPSFTDELVSPAFIIRDEAYVVEKTTDFVDVSTYIVDGDDTDKTYTEEDKQEIIREIRELETIDEDVVPLAEGYDLDYELDIDFMEYKVNEIIEDIGNEIVDEALNGPTYDFSQVPLEQDLIDVIIEECEEHGIPVPVIFGLIQLESSFHVNSDSGSHYGLMQLSKKYFPKNLSYEDNIRYGINYLASHFETTGNIRIALDAYHAGHVTGDTSYPGTVMRYAEQWAEVTGMNL